MNSINSSSKSFYKKQNVEELCIEFEQCLNNIEKALENLENYISKMEDLNMTFAEMIIRYGYDIDGIDIGVDSSTIHFSKTIPTNSFIYCDSIVMPGEIISNINIIVPSKVVEIRFGDGNKEKMVCHEDDTFDLRKCCFIAIAKHLYKKEYTQEGIEYMATQLTYQKKYVKIVDKALKDYWKKEEEKEKKIRDEREREKIQERQREKRRRYKERRTQRYKEVMVDLIADSINEAKKRRKREKE